VISDAVIDAFEEAGIPRTADINDEPQEGATFGQLTLRRGLRQSAAVAYLHPVMRRPNLHVVTNALTELVLIEDGKATGVRFSRDGQVVTVRTRREVILAGGALNSPQLLQLSGIGPGDLLRDLGITVRVESPNVGGNLQDHFAVMTRSRLKPGTPSLNELSRGVRLAGEILRFVLRRRGLITAGGSHVTAFARSRPELDRPDFQFFSSPATADLRRTVAAGRMIMETEPGVTIGGYRMRPQSRGSVRIASSDPGSPPRIVHNYLVDPSDQQAVIDGLRLGRMILAQPAIAQHIDHEITPGRDTQTDEALIEFARNSGTTAYHEAGSCAMGDRPTSVLDPRLRVNGVERLRVVDASAMPVIVSGNTNASTIMIAEKAADMILADAA